MLIKKYLLITLFILGGIFLSGLCPPALAQTAPTTQATMAQPNYQAAFLDNATSFADFAGKSYILKETKTPLTVDLVQSMIRDGSILSHVNYDSYVDLGMDGHGTWIVLPVANRGGQQLWTLHLGNFWDGRFSNLKQLMLLNMNSGEVLLDSLSPSSKNKNIPTDLQLIIPAHETVFFILYLKPNTNGFCLVSPSLSPSNKTGILDILSLWLPIIMGFAAFISFLHSQISGDRERLWSDLCLALMWAGVATQLFLSSNFLYIGTFGTELISPFIWIFISLMMLMALLFMPDHHEKIPTSLLNGITSFLATSGFAGVVILKALPALSLYLIYVPVFAGYVLTAAVCWFLVTKEESRTHIPLCSVSSFMGLVIAVIGAFYLGIIPANSITVALPQLFVLLAIISSIAGHVLVVSRQIVNDDSRDVLNTLSENQLSKKEMSKISEAKEKSEHHRLIKVIEEERKTMTELQVRTAQQNEEMRLAKEQADEANRAKSAFLAVVSHEIRTPMTGIMGMLRLLQGTQLSKEQKEYTSTIKDSGDAMLALLNDILDFEKIESGKMDLENISFDLRRLVKGVYTLMRGHADAKNIELVVEIDETTPVWVRGDPTRLRQVLLNLVNNAIKFTTKGNVYLRARDLTGDSVNPVDPSYQIYFAVQDSGIGISPDAQKRLFMPFAQADSTISRKYGGTGLGLAICKRLIDAMGGSISINSKEGEGATFFFTLSMGKGHEVKETSTENYAPDPSAIRHPLHVLVVDDNGINQKVVAGFVEKLGGTSKTAGSGADALHMMSQYSFDLILMDLQLPDMSGIDVAKAIRKLPIESKAKTPIVALSGNTDAEDKRACADAGMDDFAEKPITLEKLASLMGRIDEDGHIRSTGPIILDFASGDDTDSESSTDKGDTLPADEGDIIFSDTSTDFLKDEDLSLTEDEEDSFALAVRKFEEMEKTGGAPQPAGNSPAGSLAESGLDETILKSLRDGLSVTQIEEILVSFYEKADELIAAIGMTHLEGDALNLYARAHELKGMAGNFGFSTLSAMCASIERAAKDNHLDAAQGDVNLLGEKYATARKRLSVWLNGE